MRKPEIGDKVIFTEAGYREYHDMYVRTEDGQEDIHVGAIVNCTLIAKDEKRGELIGLAILEDGTTANVALCSECNEFIQQLKEPINYVILEE